LLLAVALTATSCGSGDDKKTVLAAAPERGGTLTFLASGDASGLDPFSTSILSVADGNRLSALYDVLVWTDPATGVVQPQMADSLTPGADSSEWTLRLKPGIKFSDGTPLDAEAVKFTWATHADPNRRSQEAGSARGLKLTVEDPLTLKIKLPAPNANFDRTISNALNFIVSPTAYAKDPKAFSANPVGAGPFVMGAKAAGQQMELDRNAGYWQQGKPYLDKIVFKVGANLDSHPKLIKKGEADLAASITQNSITEARAENLDVHSLNLNGGLMIAFNNRKPPFDDKRARQAVVAALSGQEINDRYYGGKGTPGRGIFSSTSPLSNNRLAPAENDAGAARALFRQLAAEGKKVQFEYTTSNDPGTKRIADYLAEKLAAYSDVGVSVKVNVVDVPTLVKSVLSNNFQAALSGNWADDPEPLIYSFLHSDDQANITGFKDAEVDKALERARSSSDAEARRAEYVRVQVRLNQELPFWVFQEAQSAIIAGPGLLGVQPYNDGLVLFDRIAKPKK
jgi:peptide/nickel transport system substrate-binding protein